MALEQVLSAHVAIAFDVDGCVVQVTGTVPHDVVFAHFNKLFLAEAERAQTERRHLEAETWKAKMIKPNEFMEEVLRRQAIAEREGGEDRELVYDNTLIDWVEQGRLPGLTNSLLHELGAYITPREGVVDAMTDICAQTQERFGVVTKFYALSGVPAPLVEGSELGRHVEKVWGQRFTERPDAGGAPRIARVSSPMRSTDKPIRLLQIMKGLHRGINDYVPMSAWLVDPSDVAFVADGPSDRWGWELLRMFRQLGRRPLTVAVYEDTDQHFAAATELQGEVDYIFTARFTPGSDLRRLLTKFALDRAEGIAARREAARNRGVRPAVPRFAPIRLPEPAPSPVTEDNAQA